MRRLSVALLLVGLVASPAVAAELHGTSETMINLFPDPVRRELRIVAPFVQWLNLRAERLGDIDLSVHLSGWGGFDLGNAWFDGRGAGDLSLANLRWRDREKGIHLTLGRQYLLLGLSRAEHFDGLHFGKDLPSGFRVETFGGVRAGPRLSYQAGNWLVGGRLSHRWGHLVTSGISFLQAREGEALQRELIGADVVARPKRWLELGLGGLFDTIGYQVAQLDAFATFYPRRGVRVMVDWRRVVPVALLDKTSIFHVFSDAVRNEAGGDLSWRLYKWLTLRADGHLLRFDNGNGYRAGASAVFGLGSTTVVARAARWQDEDQGYTQIRAAVRNHFSKAFFAALDVQGYFYDVGIDGKTASYAVIGTIGYRLSRRLRAVLALEGGITPQFETRGQIMGRLEYSFFKSF